MLTVVILKVRLFNLLIKTPRYRISIGKPGDANLVSEDLIKGIALFVLYMLSMANQKKQKCGQC